MPKICYQDKAFGRGSLVIIGQANEIIDAYRAEGFVLTLRQLYYQFVSRDLLPNTMKSYKRLGSIVNDARLAGLIDWDAIEDRTRSLRRLPHWDEPSDIIDDAAAQFRIDMWEGQEYRPEVWIEKDALAGIIATPCEEWAVSYFPCRGYVSQSEMWAAALRMQAMIEKDQTPVIFHFGDHDPSGIDMSRDIVDRLEIFGTGGRVRFERLALNRDQITKYKPPPNPAKTTDSRFAQYIRIHGGSSWELDALDPRALAKLVSDAIKSVMDQTVYKANKKRQDEGRATLRDLAAEHRDRHD